MGAAMGEINLNRANSSKSSGSGSPKNSKSPKNISHSSSSSTTPRGSPNNKWSFGGSFGNGQHAVTNWAAGVWDNVKKGSFKNSFKGGPPDGPRREDGQSYSAVLHSEAESAGPRTSSSSSSCVNADIRNLRIKLVELLEHDRLEEAAEVKECIEALLRSVPNDDAPVGDMPIQENEIPGNAPCSNLNASAPTHRRLDLADNGSSLSGGILNPPEFTRSRSAGDAVCDNKSVRKEKRGSDPIVKFGTWRRDSLGDGEAPLTARTPRNYEESETFKHVRTASVPLPKAINAIDYHPASAVCAIM